MPGEPENQCSLTCSAANTSGHANSKFLSITIARLTILAGIFIGSAFGASANQLTFNVNMVWQKAWGAFHPESGDTVVVSGTFSSPDWTTNSTLSPSVFDCNTYAGTFNNDVPAGSFVQFKFIINPGGNSQPNQLIWESGNNRAFQVASFDQTFTGAYFNNVTNGPPVNTNATKPLDFIAGADMSHLAYFESIGIVYRVNGAARDALAILKSNGLNCVRLRLFTSSQSQALSNPYDYINNTNYAIPLALRVKNAGLKLLLDFHYSDSWADPGKQFKPSAWTNLNFVQLAQQMRDYSSNTIAAFAAAGAIPDYVQVGNEITGGLLWDDGRVGGSYDTSAQWSQLAQLMTNAIRGIKDAAGTNQPKIIVHIDRGADWGATQWFFDNLTNRNVPFDIIGQSYYPFWHGSLSSLENCLTNTANRYGKPVLIAETDFPYQFSTNIFGIPATTNGQVQFVVALAEIVKGIPNGLGTGIVWWGAEYQPVSGANQAGFGNRSFFNDSGNVLPVAAAIGQLVAPVRLTAERSNNNLKITWPLSGAGMSLTTSPVLSSLPVWQPVTNAIQNTGAVFSVTLPLGDQKRFYRLQSD